MSFFYNKKILCIFLTFAVVSFCFPLSAMSVDKSYIEKKRIETRKKIKRLRLLESQETNKLYRNQQKLEKSQKKLKTSKKKYNSAKSKIGSLQKDLSSSLADFAIYEFQARNRIRQIYKKQRRGLFELLLASDDLNILLDRIYYQNLIAKRDKKKLNSIRQRARRIARLKYSMEEQKQVLANSISNINYQQKNISSAIKRNSSVINRLRTSRQAYERAERELARQSSNLENMISRNTEVSEVKIVSRFLKPVNGRITSYFGWRTHPIFKSRTFHSGLDLGAPHGSTVKASNSGKVIYAGWYGGYGKVVIIDHGKYNGVPTTTLYAHLSSYKVKVGDSVARGQAIARVGSTGYSTGPHLHFEIRVKGKPSNPLNYI